MVEPVPPKRKRLNLAQKRALRAAEARLFVQRYGRKAQKGVEPNDRRYGREAERALKRLEPMDLDRLIRDDEE